MYNTYFLTNKYPSSHLKKMISVAFQVYDFNEYPKSDTIRKPKGQVITRLR